MPGESPLDGQGIVVEAQDDVSLGVEQKGSCRGAWLKGEFITPRRDTGSGGFLVQVGAHRRRAPRGRALGEAAGGHGGLRAGLESGLVSVEVFGRGAHTAHIEGGVGGGLRAVGTQSNQGTASKRG